VRDLFHRYRKYLTNYESILAYSLLGIVGGIASGLAVLGFELAIHQLAALGGVSGSGERFEALPQWQIFALPTAGALVLGLLYTLLRPEDRETGIIHVIDRMHSHYGVLPLRNALLQFAAGAFSLATGQSGGREGPGVHLGGAVNSLMGQRLGLPHNSLRVLIACGTAGGISAAFNTPLAGVIFAMEVIVAEYTVVGFVPVILAAVSASAISLTYSPDIDLLHVPAVHLGTLWEIPYVLLLGLASGLAAALFVWLLKRAADLTHWPVAIRFSLAGALTGGLALLAPQILGMGSDTLAQLVRGEMAVTAVAIFILCKLPATAIGCGAGMPIGVIGPSLLIGAGIGSMVGALGHLLQPGQVVDPALYVVLGMAATMAATLNAPLAAILAVIEMTNTVSIGMPALLAVVAADLTNVSFFGQRSAHQTLLRRMQKTVPDDPLNQFLHRTDITTAMDVRVVKVPALLQSEDREPLLEHTPAWCLVEREGKDLYLVQGAELLAWLTENTQDDQPADLTEAKIRRWSLAPVPVQATLRQALDTMRQGTVEAVSVYERSRSSGKRILHGVLTRDGIEKFSLSRL